jgi:hypothetical protein
LIAIVNTRASSEEVVEVLGASKKIMAAVVTLEAELKEGIAKFMVLGGEVKALQASKEMKEKVALHEKVAWWNWLAVGVGFAAAFYAISIWGGGRSLV